MEFKLNLMSIRNLSSVVLLAFLTLNDSSVVAQEIEKIIPEVVHTDENGYKSVAYGNITGLLIEAVKELKQEIEELKKQIK